MIEREPYIKVGILDGVPSLQGSFHGAFLIGGTRHTVSDFFVLTRGDELVLHEADGTEIAHGDQIFCEPVNGSTFLLKGVIIGVKFHWQRHENQTFKGGLRLATRRGGMMAAINEIPLEDYLKSVISSEMSAECPIELLRAHAVTSRSWLAAMLTRASGDFRRISPPTAESAALHDEIVRWYTRQDHDMYDVCADDHCQRYQGITKIISSAVDQAVESTRGHFLVHGNTVCDARYYKSCGGLTDEFPNAWEDTDVPYLQCVSDSAKPHPPIRSEAEAEKWILSEPEAYCNTHDPEILRRILPPFDQETTDFFRWRVEYTRSDLEQILLEKSGIDFGTLQEIVPISRGPSGRLNRLKIVGSARKVMVGKELEIRRWLSPSHLYSSAFIVRTERTSEGAATRFIFQGAGWGHGVGLCQIGAAVMAVRGFAAERILTHYFKNVQVKKLY